MSFEPSAESYGAPPRRVHHRPHPRESKLIAEDRRRVRHIKRLIGLVLNMGLATGGISSAVRAAAHKKGPRVLAKELHEAEVKLHHDIAKARERAGGPRAPSMGEIRRRHRPKSPEQAGQEAVSEAADPAAADQHDADAAGTSAEEVKDASDDAGSSADDHDAAVSVAADTNVSVLKSPWFWGFVLVGGAAYAGRGEIAKVFHAKGAA